jgi:Xaa-Pro aminopeptidase
MNELPFRQDSTFLYFTGCTLPDAYAWLDHDGCTLFLPEPADDDDLWHGHVDDLETQRQRYGVEHVAPVSTLSERLLRGRPRTLAIADTSKNRQLSKWTGQPLTFGKHHGDPELVSAVIAMRRTKSAFELDEMRRAAELTAGAHRFVMAASKPGVHERALTALFEAYIAVREGTLGYATILTQRGEVLHNHAHDAALEAGRLLLLDGGAERASGYGADVTRTWPVSGRFTPRQRAAYDAVLESQQQAIAACRVGVRYREVHDTACRVLARFLLDEGLLHNISVDDAVERGAHALFFPHGIGHLLGLDVHDLENFGDLPAYPPGQGRPEPFGTRYLRLDLPLEAGWAVTIEPGFYVAPAILGHAELRERFRDVLRVDALEPWMGFGGIRIEDDVVITNGDPEVLTEGAPKDPDAVEQLVGSGADMSLLLP